MLKNKSRGTHFWYADRNLKKPVECEIVDRQFGHPEAIIAKNLTTGQLFRCFTDFGCYDLRSYSGALKDSQIEEDRIIY